MISTISMITAEDLMESSDARTTRRRRPARRLRIQHLPQPMHRWRHRRGLRWRHRRGLRWRRQLLTLIKYAVRQLCQLSLIEYPVGRLVEPPDDLRALRQKVPELA